MIHCHIVHSENDTTVQSCRTLFVQFAANRYFPPANIGNVGDSFSVFSDIKKIKKKKKTVTASDMGIRQTNLIRKSPFSRVFLCSLLTSALQINVRDSNLNYQMRLVIRRSAISNLSRLRTPRTVNTRTNEPTRSMSRSMHGCYLDTLSRCSKSRPIEGTR